MASSDVDLQSRAADGDQSSLVVLLERHGPAVRERVSTMISKHWRPTLSADDVMQVTYLEAFLNLKHFHPKNQDSFGGWLMRIAANNLRDAIKSLEADKRPDPRRRLHAPRQGSIAELYEYLGVTSATPSRAAAESEAAGVLRGAMSRLPEDYRRVIQLYDLENRPLQEVSSLMKRSFGAVYMLRSRALDHLKTTLPPASRLFSDA